MINIDTPYDPGWHIPEAIILEHPDVKPNPAFAAAAADFRRERGKEPGEGDVVGNGLGFSFPSRFLKRKVQRADNILEAAALAALVGNIGDLGYQSLAHNRDTSGYDYHTALLFKKLFQTSVHPPVAPRSYCCSHFIVSKERVLRRPLAFYADARKLFTTNDGYKLPPFPRPIDHDLEGRTLCQNMMKFWHLVFGHPQLRTPLRHRDKTVPYFLKGRNLKMSYESE